MWDTQYWVTGYWATDYWGRAASTQPIAPSIPLTGYAALSTAELRRLEEHYKQVKRQSKKKVSRGRTRDVDIGRCDSAIIAIRIELARRRR